MASKKIGLDEIRKMIRKRLEENQETHIAGVEENPKITIRLEYDERRPKKGNERYSVNYQLTTPEGQEIEIEGALRPYHTGRDYEYEFEPGWFAEDADSDYHEEHWEEIEEQILKKFYQTDKFEIKENEEGGGIERVYLNRDLSDYFQVPYLKNDGVETIIHSSTLRGKNSEWDKKHLALFDKYAGMDLTLKGTGLGWWKIIQALRENKNTNMNIRKLIRKTLEENYDVNETEENRPQLKPEVWKKIEDLYSIENLISIALKTGEQTYSENLNSVRFSRRYRGKSGVDGSSDCIYHTTITNEDIEIHYDLIVRVKFDADEDPDGASQSSDFRLYISNVEGGLETETEDIQFETGLEGKDLWDDYEDKISPEDKKELNGEFENIKYEAFHGDDGGDDY